MKKNILILSLITIIITSVAAHLPAPRHHPAPTSHSAQVHLPLAPIHQQAPAYLPAPTPIPHAIRPITPINTAQPAPTQLTQAETIDLAQTTTGISQVNNPHIIEIFKQTDAIIDQMAKTVDQMVKIREDLYKKYFDLDETLNDFFQNTQLGTGALEEQDFSKKQQASNQDLAQINSSILAISASKESIKKLLATIDSNLAKGKELVATAHKKNMDMLSQSTEEAAKALQNEIEKSVGIITSMLQSLQGAETQNIQTLMNQIKTMIQTVQTTLAQAKAKKEAEQVAQAQVQVQAAQNKASNLHEVRKEAFASWLVPNQSTEEHKQAEASTMIHYVFNKAADVITEIFGYFYRTYESLFNKTTKKAAPIGLNQSQVNKNMSVEKPVWRKNVEAGFSHLLDFMVAICDGIFFYVNKFYQSWIAPMFHKVSSDVAAKVKEDAEKKKAPEQPAPAPKSKTGKQSGPIPSAIPVMPAETQAGPIAPAMPTIPAMPT